VAVVVPGGVALDVARDRAVPVDELVGEPREQLIEDLPAPGPVSGVLVATTTVRRPGCGSLGSY
jgi:hypothetical protein